MSRVAFLLSSGRVACIKIADGVLVRETLHDALKICAWLV